MNKKEKFGELHLKDFSVGDIVEWSACHDRDWETNYPRTNAL